MKVKVMEINHYQLKNILKEYLKISPYLNDIINNHKKSDTWKINFMSSKDADLERLMHSNSDKVGIVINDKGDKIIEEQFQSLLSRYQMDL